MNYKDPNKDSGNYINGIYTSKNGFSGSGLNCPKGTRLYSINVTQPIFFKPEDSPKDEVFKRLTSDICPDILPYYAISNHGRVINTRSGKVMKPNYRPNGYEYYCLAADNCKNGQKKYTTHRAVMMKFHPIEGMERLEINHKNGIKSDNYVDKVMPDGSIESNLEWATHKENIEHARNNFDTSKYKLSFEDAKKIREYHDQGYSYAQIQEKFYNYVSCRAIQDVCTNKTYRDENYKPLTYTNSYLNNPANVHRLTDHDVATIRKLADSGMKYEEIKSRLYPDYSICTISDIIRRKTHNN